MNSTNRNAAAEARGVPETDQLGGKVNRENSLASGPVQGQRGGRRSRAKGDRIERAPLPQPRVACDPRFREMIESTYRCAAHSTVEALMFSLRRGVRVLDKSDTRRRLAELDDGQALEVAERVQRLHAEIAPAWTADEVERLLQLRESIR